MGVLHKIRGGARPAPSVTTGAGVTSTQSNSQAGPSSPKSTRSSSQASIATSSNGGGSPRLTIDTLSSPSKPSPVEGGAPGEDLSTSSKATLKPKSGILVNSQYQASPMVNTLSYNQPSAHRQSLLLNSSATNKRGMSAGEGITRTAQQLTFGAQNVVPRAASHSDLSSFDFQPTTTDQQRSHVRLVAPETAPHEKRVAYATAFDGSVVRRRQITTPSSVGSQESAAVLASTPASPSSHTAVPTTPGSGTQPEFEYSRVYYSTEKHAKRRGLRAILAL